MLTRRGFTGFASCAICGLTGFLATDASAQQGAQPLATGTPPTPGIKRKILSQTDGPVQGYVTIAVIAEVAAGTIVERHTHPGMESGYVIEGSFALPIDGKGNVSLEPGDTFQVPPYTPHDGGEPPKTNVKLALTYVVEKDKPLASPA
jgi:quercetin dioxygenase-like cupin family protein